MYFTFLGILLLNSLSEALGSSYCPNNVLKSLSYCSRSFALVDLKDYRNLILSQHNDRRNKLAEGRNRLFDQASFMGEMHWSEELEELASLTIKQCNDNSITCTETKKFKSPGQNIGKESYGGWLHRLSTKRLVQELIRSWWDKNTFAKKSDIERLPEDFSKFEEFATMVSEKNIAVGCAAAEYHKGSLNTIILVCNYASAPLPGDKLYTTGTPVTNCKTGLSLQYQHLCSPNEVYADI